MATYILITFILTSGELASVSLPGGRAILEDHYVIYGKVISCDRLMPLVAKALSLDVKAGRCDLTTHM